MGLAGGPPGVPPTRPRAAHDRTTTTTMISIDSYEPGMRADTRLNKKRIQIDREVSNEPMGPAEGRRKIKRRLRR